MRCLCAACDGGCHILLIWYSKFTIFTTTELSFSLSCYIIVSVHPTFKVQSFLLFSPPLVHILLALSSPVRPMRVDQVGAETRALRRTSRVGPWADPFPAIHGGLDTAD